MRIVATIIKLPCHTKMSGKKISNLQRTIGSSYCHSRMFAVDQDTFKLFKSFNTLKENVIMAHQQLYSHVNSKMEKLKLRFKILQIL